MAGKMVIILLKYIMAGNITDFREKINIMEEKNGTFRGFKANNRTYSL
jgi:hypothetical protein